MSCIKVLFSCFILGFSQLIKAQDASVGFQKKINLEDVNIKGEVNKGGNLLSQRSKMNLDERIKVPKNFRKAILENLDSELDGIAGIDEKKR